jgi:hypothetical protein
MPRKDPSGWRPSGPEAEWLVDALTARIAPARIAERLGISVATLVEYGSRLHEANSAPFELSPLPPPPPPPVPVTPPITAERLFEREFRERLKL